MSTIWQLAKDIEREGIAMYESMAAQATGPQLAGAFNVLAKEESRHLKLLEDLEQTNPVSLIVFDSVIDSKEIIQSVKHEIQNEDGVLQSLNDAETGYHAALALEHKSIEQYKAIAAQAHYHVAEKVVSMIIAEEMRHVQFLENLIEFVRRPKDWVESAEFNHHETY